MKDLHKEKLSFKKEKIFIDYLAFKVENLTDFEKMEEIGKSFQKKFNYNYEILYRYTTETKINEIKRGQSKVYLSLYSCPGWRGCIISFAGNVASEFYKSITISGLPVDLFPINFSLSRVDICFTRPWTTSEKETEDELLKTNIRSFFNKCIDKPVNKVHQIDTNLRGIQLKLGNRKAASFYRIYTSPQGLRFELERKKLLAMKPLQILLLNNDISNFEDEMIRFFYKQWTRRLDLSTCYTYWLVIRLRTLFPSQYISDSVLLTHYIGTERSHFLNAYIAAKTLKPDSFRKDESWSFTDDTAFYTFLQLCSFLVKNKDNKLLKSHGEGYVKVKFFLSQFFSFIGFEKINQYQREKFFTFFKVLSQATTILQEFEDESFRLLVGIPEVLVYKKSNLWYVEIAISKQFFSYSFPFVHTDYFLKWHNMNDLRVKIMILQNFNTTAIKKTLPIKDFLHKQEVSSGDTKRSVRSYVIEAIQELKKHGYINRKITIHTKQNTLIDKTTILTRKDLTKANCIYIYENIYQRSKHRN